MPRHCLGKSCEIVPLNSLAVGAEEGKSRMALSSSHFVIAFRKNGSNAGMALNSIALR
jgi:hypothetical protein